MDSYQDSGGNGFQRYTDIVSLQDSDGANGGGVIRFVTNSISSDSGAEAMRVTKLQNLLIGTTTDTTRLTVKPGTNTYQLSLLQSNTDAAGWGMWADTSGNLNVTRYGSSAFGTPALVFSASGNATLGAGLTFSAPAILATSTTAASSTTSGALQATQFGPLAPDSLPGSSSGRSTGSVWPIFQNLP